MGGCSIKGENEADGKEGEREREREGKEQGDRQRDQSSLYLGCDQPCCELM